MTASPAPEVPRTHGNLYRRLGRNMAWLAGGTGGAALLGMLAVAFNARALTAREFGLLVLLQTSVLALRGLTTLLTQQPVIHIGSEALDEGDRARLGRVIGLALLYDFGGALAASALGVTALLLGGEAIGITGELHRHAFVFAAALPFMGYLTANGIFRLLDRFDLMSALQSGSALLLVTAAGALYWIGAPFSAYVWTWAIYLAASAQVPLWTALWLARRHDIHVSFRLGELSSADRAKVSAYCWSSWGVTLVDTLRTQGDALLVGAMVGVEAAGFYNVAKQVAGVLRKVTDMYSSATFPEIATLRARGDAAASRQLRRRLILAGIAALVVGVAGIALVGRPLLGWVFGPGFVAGYGALVLLVAAAGVQLVAHTQANYVQIYLTPGKLFPIYLTALLAFLGAVFVGLQGFGITGGAAGQLAFSLTVIVLASIALKGTLPDGP